jgi:hypothetical protein
MMPLNKIGVEPSETGTAVGDDRGDQLIDFMGDRGRQLAHGRHDLTPGFARA